MKSADGEVIALSENEKDYSDYRQVLGNLSNIVVLLSGFTFTVITILLSQFPVLGSLTSQLILFFLASLFFLFILLLGLIHSMLTKLCRNFPPVTKDIAVFNRLMVLSWVLLQLAVVLMFLIWGLVFLVGTGARALKKKITNFESRTYASFCLSPSIIVIHVSKFAFCHSVF